MKHLRIFRVAWCIVACMAIVSTARAQTASRWPPPEPNYSVDFGSDDSGRQVVFLASGAALEIPLDFLLIKHPRVTVRARLPEPGSFEVEQVNPKAMADVVRKGPDRFEITAKLSAVSRSDAGGAARKRLKQLAAPYRERLGPEAQRMSKSELARFLRSAGAAVPGPKPKEEEGKQLERLREAYVDRRALEEIAPELREKLEEIAAARPAWVPAKDRAAWGSASAGALRDDFLTLSEWEIMDEHLKRCGLGFDSNTVGFQRKLEGRIDALYLVLAGKVGENPAESARIAQVLGQEDRQKLRDTLTVQLRLRFFPEVDPEDPNAQWFNAQRVACRASGVALIRLAGSLNPAEHDRVDWWFVEGYKPSAATVSVGEGKGFQISPPFPCDGGARLRIVATGKQPAEYSIEFRPTGAPQGDRNVVVYESPSWPGAEFPY